MNKLLKFTILAVTCSLSFSLVACSNTQSTTNKATTVALNSTFISPTSSDMTNKSDAIALQKEKMYEALMQKHEWNETFDKYKCIYEASGRHGINVPGTDIVLNIGKPVCYSTFDDYETDYYTHATTGKLNGIVYKISYFEELGLGEIKDVYATDIVMPQLLKVLGEPDGDTKFTYSSKEIIHSKYWKLKDNTYLIVGDEIEETYTAYFAIIDNTPGIDRYYAERYVEFTNSTYNDFNFK